MKKLLSLCLVSFGLLFGTSIAANEVMGGYDDVNYAGGTYESQGTDACCTPPAEHACGDSYQLYCKYEPCYYNEYRTVCDEKCVPKQCCRYVNKPYQKTCCKMVPQYYTVSCDRQCPEYYTVNETVKCYRKVCDRKCKWVPKYYYKHECGTATPAQGCCK